MFAPAIPEKPAISAICYDFCVDGLQVLQFSFLSREHSMPA